MNCFVDLNVNSPKSQFPALKLSRKSFQILEMAEMNCFVDLNVNSPKSQFPALKLLRKLHSCQSKAAHNFYKVKPNQQQYYFASTYHKSMMSDSNSVTNTKKLLMIMNLKLDIHL